MSRQNSGLNLLSLLFYFRLIPLKEQSVGSGNLVWKLILKKFHEKQTLRRLIMVLMLMVVVFWK